MALQNKCIVYICGICYLVYLVYFALCFIKSVAQSFVRLATVDLT